MRILYLDCGMGAAGDMLTASLLQLFSEPVKQVKKLNDLKIPGVKYQLVACTRGGIRGYQVRVFVKKRILICRRKSRSDINQKN